MLGWHTSSRASRSILVILSSVSAAVMEAVADRRVVNMPHVSGIVSGVVSSYDPEVLPKRPGWPCAGGSSRRADLGGNEEVVWR
jgi:hypothetical protein